MNLSQDTLNKIISYLCTCRWDQANPIIIAIEQDLKADKAEPVEKEAVSKKLADGKTTK